MLFQRHILDGIAAGHITLAFRRWRKPTVRGGGTLKTAAGVLRILAVDAIGARDISDHDARLAGYASAAEVRRELESAIDATSNNRGLVVNLAINYGGRTEIVDAVNSILEMARLDGSIHSLKIDEDLIATSLYTAACPDPDLLIRTAGEMRISNFLLWQISYAEIWVTDKCWPEFDEGTLHQAIRDFAGRERRFGGLNQ